MYLGYWRLHYFCTVLTNEQKTKNVRQKACPFCLSGRQMKSNTQPVLLRTSVSFALVLFITPVLFRNKYTIGDLSLFHKCIHGSVSVDKGLEKNVCTLQAKREIKSCMKLTVSSQCSPLSILQKLLQVIKPPTHNVSPDCVSGNHS